MLYDHGLVNVHAAGPFDHTGRCPAADADALEAAVTRYQAAKATLGSELLVSGSDDFTMFLWDPVVSSDSLRAKHSPHNSLPFCRCSLNAGVEVAQSSHDWTPANREPH